MDYIYGEISQKVDATQLYYDGSETSSAITTTTGDNKIKVDVRIPVPQKPINDGYTYVLTCTDGTISWRKLEDLK